MTLTTLQHLGQAFDAGDVNPFYAAFMRSIGLPETLQAVQAYARANSNAPFMDFIARAKASAPQAVVKNGRIIDSAAWAEHVEAHGWVEHRDRFPVCGKCAHMLCSCSDADWVSVRAVRGLLEAE